ncbi:MAG: hypothetical protein HOW73_29290 [Polyangiaceae bacterium]|nr:hypothetical protein [Polyangiaceae bacterium]
MSYLTLDADRLVRDAVDAYLEGRMRADARGDCVFATRNSQYRIVEGVVQEASDTSLMGAELVGWLCEELGQPLVEPRWRPYGRAILVERNSRHVVVTSRTLTRNAISGNVAPIPPLRKVPSVIPPSPPIPVLKASAPPPAPDGSPTPFRLPDAVRNAAFSIEAHDSYVPPDVAEVAANERPTRRPPTDEATVSADRSSYEDLLEASRTPSWGGGPLPSPGAPSAVPSIPKPPPVPPPEPTRPIQLPPVNPPPKATMIGPGPIAPHPPVQVAQADDDGPWLELEPDEPSEPRR